MVSACANLELSQRADVRVTRRLPRNLQRLQEFRLLHRGSTEFRHQSPFWITFRSAPTGKTKESSGVRLKIQIEPDSDLANVIARCRDDVASPFLVHRLPVKARPREMRATAREHHTQVLPEQLSRAFAQARRNAGIVGTNPATYHEIRSLGGALLREIGWSVAQVQTIMTHASEAMTELYLGGHEVPWTEVAAAATLDRIGRK